MGKKITVGPTLGSLTLWAGWVLIAPLGVLLFFVFWMVLAAILAKPVFGPPSIEIALGFLITGTIIGSFTGFLQWLLLRKRFPRSGLWILTVIAGWVLACEASMFYPQDLSSWNGPDLPILILALAALLASPFQYLLIRKLNHAAWWPLIVLIGSGIAAAWGYYLVNESSLFFLVSYLLSLLMGTMLTGMGILWLFYRPAEGLRQLIGATALTATLVTTGILVNELAFSQQTRLLRGHDFYVLDLAFNHDGSLLASAAMDGSVILREMPSGRIIQRIIAVQDSQSSNSSTINQVAFSPDSSRLVTASGDGFLKVWDITSGELVFARRIGQDAYKPCAIFSPDSQRLLASMNVSENSVSLWYIDGYLKAGSTPVPGFVYALGFSNGITPAWLVRSDDQLTWMTATGPVVYTTLELSQVDLCTRRVAMSPDGSHVAITLETSSEKGEWIHAIVYTPGQVEGMHYIGGNYFSSLAFSPDGRLLVAPSLEARPIKIWDTQDWTVVTELHGGHTITAVATSPDGKTIATGSLDGVVRLWKLPKAP